MIIGIVNIFSGKPRALRFLSAAQYGDPHTSTGPQGCDEFRTLRELSLPQTGRIVRRRETAQDQLEQVRLILTIHIYIETPITHI